MDAVVTAIILFSCTCGLLFSLLYTYHTSLIRIGGSKSSGILHGAGNEDALAKVVQISKAISDGAQAFLWAEYVYMAKFIFLFSILLAVCLGLLHDWSAALFSVISFVTGAVTSIICGYIGMMIATYTNSRTAVAAMDGWGPPFVTAFKGGVVMGFALTSLGILVLYILICCFNLFFTTAYTDAAATRQMYECVAGYGLGGSSVALFGRVGGGIYTKAADVGADLCKIEHKMDEDSPQNPAVIADNVGDNVGDIAGMGADLFGSFAESSCACMVIASQSPELFSSYTAMSFPLVLASCGIIACIFTSFFATHIMVVKSEPEVEQSLKRQIMVSTVIMTPVVWFVCQKFLPPTFTIGIKLVHNWHVFYCVAMGLWSGMAIGYVTEYFTSNSYAPTRQVANACNTGAATNIIYGLALGYKSVIVPVFCLAATIYVGYSFAGMFGVGSAALGILSTMSIGLTIDAYGPICDNAGGIAEMAGMGADIRVRTDALDAAGNTTAAIGKGFAIGSAALVSLALFGAFITTVGLQDVDILQPFEFSGLLVGAMLPYWFSAMTMKSVGKAALAMVLEVREQFLQNPKLLDPNSGALPDYQRCIAISTRASLNEMIPPGALVMLTPVIVGFLFGVEALAGVLAGSLVSGVQMAISASNSGGAWDNAKKYIEKGNLGPDKAKGSEVHDASVIGDTVGDPLKDTSGPALNILIKLSAIISLVFAPSFPAPAKGGYLQQLISPS